MTSKHQFQSTELKITGCEFCQIQWLRHERNFLFHQKMLHCHSPVTLWCSIDPLHNISDSFLLTLSCKLDSTSTQSAALTGVALGTCSQWTMPSLWENANGMILIFNVTPCMLPHLLYNPTHALFTL